MRYAAQGDEAFWFALDHHLPKAEFARKVRDRHGYVIQDGDKPVGLLRYNLFWDEIPFLTLLYLQETHRGKGFGKRAMRQWEKEMAGAGYAMAITSTMVNEQAQHFYRRLGYMERGALFLDNTPLAQPGELLMVKVL